VLLMMKSRRLKLLDPILDPVAGDFVLWVLVVEELRDSAESELASTMRASKRQGSSRHHKTLVDKLMHLSSKAVRVLGLRHE